MYINPKFHNLGQLTKDPNQGQSEIAKRIFEQPVRGASRTQPGTSFSSPADHGMKVVLDSVNKAMANQGFTNAVANQPNRALETGEPDKGIFDFEKVADEVLTFVSQSIYSAQKDGASDEKLQTMLDQAREGVALGFQQAKDDLDGAKLLDEDLEAGIDKSFELIGKGIDELESKLFDPAAGIENPMVQKTSYASSLYASVEQSSEIVINTKEGDKVTINFNNFQETQQNESYSRIDNPAGTKEGYGFSQTEYTELNFSYSVQGDLSEEEQAAISSLIEDMSSVQQDFFSGNLDQALSKANELGFDSSVLQGYSFDFEQTETYQVTQVYTDVANLPQNNQQELLDKLTKPLFDYAAKFNDLKERAENIIADGKEQFNNLMTEVLKAGFDDGKVDFDAMKERFNQFNQALMNDGTAQQLPEQPSGQPIAQPE
jgi:hypothetical protein